MVDKEYVKEDSTTEEYGHPNDIDKCLHVKLHPQIILTSTRQILTAKEPRGTTVLSLLPIVVLEIIFSYLNIDSIENLYDIDPYIENVMDGLISVQNLKENLFREEQIEFEKKQFAFWKERLRLIHRRNKKKLD